MSVRSVEPVMNKSGRDIYTVPEPRLNYNRLILAFLYIHVYLLLTKETEPQSVLLS